MRPRRFGREDLTKLTFWLPGPKSWKFFEVSIVRDRMSPMPGFLFCFRPSQIQHEMEPLSIGRRQWTNWNPKTRLLASWWPLCFVTVFILIGILVLVFGCIVWGRGPTAFSTCGFFLSQNIIFLATIHCSAFAFLDCSFVVVNATSEAFCKWVTWFTLLALKKTKHNWINPLVI